MLKIIRSHDRHIFNMGIPIPGKDGLYIEMGPRRQAIIGTNDGLAYSHKYVYSSLGLDGWTVFF